TMTDLTRRSFNQKMLGTLMAYGLIETLFTRDLFADAVKPIIHQWMKELSDLTKDVKDGKIKDLDFQAKLEALYKRVDLPELLRLLDMDRVARSVRLPDHGAASRGIDLGKVEGLPKQLHFGKQIFCMKKGRSVVPHGHDNMCTGFIVLRGDFEGKHYDRVEDHADHYLIRPTIDRRFGAGETSTVSDHKDNVHWFTSESETGFIFNVHVNGYNRASEKVPARVYVDPIGEKVAGGLTLARK